MDIEVKVKRLFEKSKKVKVEDYLALLKKYSTSDDEKEFTTIYKA